MAHPLVEKMWPHVAALTDLLEGLDGSTVTVTAVQELAPGAAAVPMSGDDIVEAIKNYERRNGDGWRR